MSITLHETSIFFQILEKILPNTLFYDTFDAYMDITRNNGIKIDFINQSFMNNFKEKNITIPIKFQFLKDFENNPFISIEKKQEIFNCFSLAQKTAFGFYKLSQIVKIKKCRHYESECDLCLEPLSTQHPKFVVSIIQRNTLYKFRIHDLIRLIQNGLVYAPELFSEPQVAKNPYTNLIFSNTDLYNIYFHILKADMKVPIILKMYFLSNFDMTALLDKYESVLRDESIKCNLKEMDNDDKYDEIMDMVDKYKRVLPSINIDPEFSQDKVVERFDHTLIHFMYSKYSYNPAFRLKHKRIVINLLKKVNDETPSFGRRIVRLRRNPMWDNTSTPYDIFHNSNSFNSNLLNVISNIDTTSRPLTNTTASTSISLADSEINSITENDDDDDDDDEAENSNHLNNNIESTLEALLNQAELTIVGERIVSDYENAFVNTPSVYPDNLESLIYRQEEPIPPLTPLTQLTQLAQLAQREIDNNNESDQMSENDVNSEINSTIVSNQPYDEALSDFSDYEMDDVADTDDMDANSDPR